MQRLAPIFAAVLLGLAATQSPAQTHAQMDHEHMAMAPDTRRELDFPPMARAHMLGNMRSHFIALQEILAALAAGDGARAGKVARDRLGASSPNAAACVKPKSDGGMSHADMGAMMAHFMPDEMRALGLTMHESADAFADVAEKLAPAGDLRPAVAALAQVTQNCAACHAAYKLR